MGVRVGYIEQFGGDKVAAIQPLYQVGGGYIPGHRFGAVGVRGGATVIARPGYAVGAIYLRQGLIVDVFQRVEKGRLVLDESYTSDWIGDPGGGSPSTASGDGRPVVGLNGRAGAQGVQRLGLVVAQQGEGRPSSRPDGFMSLQ